MFFHNDHVGIMEWYRLVFNVSITLSIILRLLFVFTTNSFVVYGIKRSRRFSNVSISGSNNHDETKNRHSTIVLLISSTSIIFGLPDVIYSALSTYHNDSDTFSSNHIESLTTRCYCINRTINIIYFCAFGTEFRQHLKELLIRPCKSVDMSNSLTLS